MQKKHDVPTCSLAWLLALVSVMAALGACASVSPMSRAETIASGKSEVAVGMEALIPEDDSGDSANDDQIAFGLGPVFSYRRGLTDSVDASIRIYFIGVSADVRYALSKGDFSASVGAQVGTSSVGVTIGDSKDEFGVTSLEAPLYLEYKLSSSVGVLLVPRVGVARFTQDNGSNTGVIGLVALAIPFQIGSLGVIPSLSSGYYGNARVFGSSLGFTF